MIMMLLDAMDQRKNFLQISPMMNGNLSLLSANQYQTNTSVKMFVSDEYGMQLSDNSRLTSTNFECNIPTISPNPQPLATSALNKIQYPFQVIQEVALN